MSIRAFLLVLLLAPGVLRAQDDVENRLLDVTPLAGQQVAVLPLTYVIADPALETDSLWAPWTDRRLALRRADSLVSGELEMRAPEVTWILPADLRKLYRRAPGMLQDPDQLGQAMLRNERMDRVPDQLNASLRKYSAMAGGRMVLVPAATAFSPSLDGTIRADLSLALVDSRRGLVVWRSRAVGLGPTPDAALRAAAALVFP